MGAELRVAAFTGSSLASVVDGLRALADAIEAEGKTVHNVAYVVDKGDGDVDVGVLGHAPHPAPTAHMLLAVGQAKLIGGVLNGR